jgi:hypothetical protein
MSTSLNTAHSTSTVLSLLAGTGALVGIGKLLVSKDRITLRVVIGRAITSAAMGSAAAVVLAFFPDLPLAAQCGIAALMASLGTSGVETLFKQIFGLDD